MTATRRRLRSVRGPSRRRARRWLVAAAAGGVLLLLLDGSSTPEGPDLSVEVAEVPEPTQRKAPGVRDGRGASSPPPQPDVGVEPRSGDPRDAWRAGRHQDALAILRARAAEATAPSARVAAGSRWLLAALQQGGPAEVADAIDLFLAAACRAFASSPPSPGKEPLDLWHDQGSGVGSIFGSLRGIAFREFDMRDDLAPTGSPAVWLDRRLAGSLADASESVGDRLRRAQDFLSISLLWADGSPGSAREKADEARRRAKAFLDAHASDSSETAREMREWIRSRERSPTSTD